MRKIDMRIVALVAIIAILAVAVAYFGSGGSEYIPKNLFPSHDKTLIINGTLGD
jgi:hypothetical protein